MAEMNVADKLVWLSLTQAEADLVQIALLQLLSSVHDYTVRGETVTPRGVVFNILQQRQFQGYPSAEIARIELDVGTEDE